MSNHLPRLKNILKLVISEMPISPSAVQFFTA